MHTPSRWIIAALVVATLALTACTQTAATATKVEPVSLEPIAGTELNRVRLTERAVERLDIQTAVASTREVGGAQRTVIPYAALIYDLHGETWIYTNPEPLVFVRQAVKVDQIDGDTAVLSEGLAAGTTVVVVGVAELYGADTGIGK